MATNIVEAYIADDETKSFQSRFINLRDVGEEDVAIKVKFCGLSMADVQTYRNITGGTTYPLSPGKEVVGEVIEIGKKVEELEAFKVGEIVGLGAFVYFCDDCPDCKDNREQYCNEKVRTYNDDYFGEHTIGGCSTRMVVYYKSLVKIPSKLDPVVACAMLNSGVCVYSAIEYFKLIYAPKVAVQPLKVAVVGLGGLGHIALGLLKRFGYNVTVISRYEAKKADAIERLKADDFIFTQKTSTWKMIITQALKMVQDAKDEAIKIAEEAVKIAEKAREEAVMMAEKLSKMNATGDAVRIAESAREEAARMEEKARKEALRISENFSHMTSTEEALKVAQNAKAEALNVTKNVNAEAQRITGNAVKQIGSFAATITDQVERKKIQELANNANKGFQDYVATLDVKNIFSITLPAIPNLNAQENARKLAEKLPYWMTRKQATNTPEVEVQSDIAEGSGTQTQGVTKADVPKNAAPVSDDPETQTEETEVEDAQERKMKEAANSMDFILVTIPNPHDVEQYLSLLKPEGVLLVVGVTSPQTMGFQSSKLQLGRKRICGSSAGSLKEMKALLDLCKEMQDEGSSNWMIKTMKLSNINGAFQELENNKAKYKIVLEA